MKIEDLWISVNERIPEDPGYYITSDGKNVGVTWKSFHRFEIMPIYHTCVTHWMPLPEPPA